MDRRFPFSMGPCRLNSGALRALAAGLYCGFGFCRLLWRVKRDVGFVIQGLWWKMDPGPGPGP